MMQGGWHWHEGASMMQHEHAHRLMHPARLDVYRGFELSSRARASSPSAFEYMAMMRRC